MSNPSTSSGEGPLSGPGGEGDFSDPPKPPIPGWKRVCVIWFYRLFGGVVPVLQSSQRCIPGIRGLGSGVGEVTITRFGIGGVLFYHGSEKRCLIEGIRVSLNPSPLMLDVVLYHNRK